MPERNSPNLDPAMWADIDEKIEILQKGF